MYSKDYIDFVFDIYGDIYRTILKKFYPALGNTGFPERNLSVNFVKAYESYTKKSNQDVYSWFEFQFGEEKNKHVDAVIMNETSREIFVIESKRYSNPNGKMFEVGEDIERVFEFSKQIVEENKPGGSKRIDISKFDRVYGVILADVWTETDKKIEIKKSYEIGTKDANSKDAFLNRFSDNILYSNDLKELKYNIQSNINSSLENYNLVSFVWEVTIEEKPIINSLFS